MRSTTLIALLLTAVTVTLAASPPARAGKQGPTFAQGKDSERNAKNTRPMNERELRELASNFKEAVLRRRGLFDCADYAEECHIFKHCCGHFVCSRENIFSKGICMIEV